MHKLLLSLLAVLIALPALARDFEYTYEGQTLTYTVIDERAKTCQTKGGNSTTGEAGNIVTGKLIIPEIAKDGDKEYKVTTLGVYSFAKCANLTSVEIPNSVTAIGSYAFWGCSGLTSFIIPNSVTAIRRTHLETART